MRIESVLTVISPKTRPTKKAKGICSKFPCISPKSIDDTSTAKPSPYFLSEPKTIPLNANSSINAGVITVESRQSKKPKKPFGVSPKSTLYSIPKKLKNLLAAEVAIFAKAQKATPMKYIESLIPFSGFFIGTKSLIRIPPALNITINGTVNIRIDKITCKTCIIAGSLIISIDFSLVKPSFDIIKT